MKLIPLSIVTMIIGFIELCPRQYNTVSLKQMIQDAREEEGGWNEEQFHTMMSTYFHETKQYTLVLVISLGTTMVGLAIALKCGGRLIAKWKVATEELEALRNARLAAEP